MRIAKERMPGCSVKENEMNVRMTLFVGLVIAVVTLLLSIVVGLIAFRLTIDNTYPQYEMVSHGKLTKYVDCYGDITIDIGGYSVPNDIRIFTKGHQQGGLRPVLKGGDCEYLLYKGWYWGEGYFYYIYAE